MHLETNGDGWEETTHAELVLLPLANSYLNLCNSGNTLNSKLLLQQSSHDYKSLDTRHVIFIPVKPYHSPSCFATSLLRSPATFRYSILLSTFLLDPSWPCLCSAPMASALMTTLHRAARTTNLSRTSASSIASFSSSSIRHDGSSENSLFGPEVVKVVKDIAEDYTSRSFCELLCRTIWPEAHTRAHFSSISLNHCENRIRSSAYDKFSRTERQSSSHCCRSLIRTLTFTSCSF